MNLTEALTAALKAATDVGDHDAAAAIASLLKKRDATPTGPTPVAPASAPSDAPAPVTVEAPIPVPASGDALAEALPPEADSGLDAAQQALYNIAQAQITEQYPDHTVESVDAATGTITITVPNTSTGVADTIQVHVTVAEDGTVTVTEAPQGEMEGDPDDVDNAPGGLTASEPPAAPHRPLMVSVGPATFQDAAGDAAWVNIINLGTYQHPEYGEMTFSKADYDSWLRNLKAGAVGGTLEDGRPAVAIDYGHAMDADLPPDQQKAAGYITDLKLDGDKVYAHVEFTRPAAQAIRDKEWPWFSVSVTDLTDKVTGAPIGAALLGGALTARPYIPGLEPIRLSDLRPSRATLLEQQLAQEQAKSARLEREAAQRATADDIAALEAAGVPPAIVRLVTPALQADASNPRLLSVTLNGKPEQVPLRRVLTDALTQLAKTGRVPTGEITGQPDHSALTLSQAADQLQETAQADGKNLRRKDALVLARKTYPHLRS